MKKIKSIKIEGKKYKIAQPGDYAKLFPVPKETLTSDSKPLKLNMKKIKAWAVVNKRGGIVGHKSIVRFGSVELLSQTMIMPAIFTRKNEAAYVSLPLKGQKVVRISIIIEE